MVRIHLDTGFNLDDEVQVFVDALQRQPSARTAAATVYDFIQNQMSMSLSFATTNSASEHHQGGLRSLPTDPFAIREGKTLTWTNVNMTLAATNKEPERKLLDDIWGEVPRNKTTAIMGPSGAGYVAKGPTAPITHTFVCLSMIHT